MSTDMTTLAGWKSRLRGLLEEARGASDDNDSRARLRICKDLLKFIDESVPTIAGTDDLDDIAIKAHQRLSEEIVDDALDQIRARTADIVALTKSVERVASEAEASAAGLRLTRAHAAVDLLTQAARAVESLDEVLTEGSDEALKGTIGELVSTIRKARGLIEKKV